MCNTLNYVEHVLILTSAFTGCISVSTFAWLVDMSLSSAVGLKTCAITARSKSSGKRKRNMIN